MPGVLLLARKSLAEVNLRIARERVRLLFTWAVLLALAFLDTRFLSRWLAEPIIDMSRALRKVAAEDLDISFPIARRDEIGFAGLTLNRMIDWLRERRKISRFVSPQVLDVVAEGDSENAIRATLRYVTLLVSDIRGFTTIFGEEFSFLDGVYHPSFLQVKTIFFLNLAGRPSNFSFFSGGTSKLPENWRTKRA